LQLLEGQYNIAPVCKHSGQIFAKTTAWNDDLYAACITPFYGADCAVESWLHGSDPEGPYCGKQTTVDVQTVQFPGAPSFSTMDDHSKWAVFNDNMTVCFGDINRMLSQYERGGAAVCIKDGALNKFLQQSILSREVCA
jgi:deoxyribonuclease-2